MFISLTCYALLLFWILEGNYKEKINHLIKSRFPIFFISIFAVIVIWAFKDLSNSNSLTDIWKNAPLFVFALVIGSRPRLTYKQFHTLLLLYVVSITINTLFSFVYYLHNYDGYSDVRNISFFMSYIRLSLYTLMGVIISVYYLFYNVHFSISNKERRFLWVCLLWLFFFVLYLGSLTGYAALISLSIVFAFAQSLKQKDIKAKVLSILLVSLCLIGASGAFVHELRLFTNPDDVSLHRSDTTLLGHSYQVFTGKGMLENGHWVNQYICEKEIQESWGEYSNMNLYKKNEKGHVLIHTLYRYLTSKNLKKDASGLAQLSKEDILLIESGCTNYRFASHYNILHRVYEVLWEIHEYRQGNNPAGHSVTQRFEFLKCSFEVFKKHMIWGTGPSELTNELNKQYQMQKMQLPSRYWYKPHNQLMLFAVKYGIVGLSIIVLSFIGIIFQLRYHMSMLSMSWIVITSISFLNEDMLDNINGLVYFAFFGSIFLSAQPYFKNIFLKPKVVPEVQENE